MQDITNTTDTGTDEMTNAITEQIFDALQSFGVSDEEIESLDLKGAWELLQQKYLDEKIEDPEAEVLYTPDQISLEYKVLAYLLKNAKDKLREAKSQERVDELVAIAEREDENIDSTPLEQYMSENEASLTEEEKFYIQMAINIKQFRARAKVILDQAEEEALEEERELEADAQEEKE